MNKVAIALIVQSSLAALAQATPPPSPEPQLSTAERRAIQADEKQKQDAQQSYQQAVTDEMTIAREFGMAHVGYHLDAQTFTVQKDAPPPTPPKPEKK